MISNRRDAAKSSGLKARRPPSERSAERGIFLAIVVLSAAFYCQYQFWLQPCGQDRSIWDYFAQEIARGGVPYRDVVDIKTPLSGYIGAAAILTARPFGLRDILAIRIVWILLSSVITGLVFLVACRAFKSRATGLLAAAVMLSFEYYSALNSVGVEPKTLVVFFGLLCLWAIHARKPLLSGVFGMLAALCWQPALIYLGVAVLASSHFLTRPFGKEAARTVAGAAAPLLLLLLHLFPLGAVKDFYNWTLLYNLSVYAPRELRTLSGFNETLREDISAGYGGQKIYFILAAAGLLLVLLSEAVRFYKYRRPSAPDELSRAAILISGLAYLSFCAVNIQGPDDLVPLLPYVAIFASVTIVTCADRIAGLLFRLTRPSRHAAIKQAAYILIVCLILFRDVASTSAYRLKPPYLEDQIQAASEITSHLGPGDKVYAHGKLHVLVLSGLRNADRHVFLDRGKDGFMDRVEPGGFAGWFAALKDARPKIVVLARLKAVDRADELVKWVESEYEAQDNGVFSYFIRKQGP